MAQTRAARPVTGARSRSRQAAERQGARTRQGRSRCCATPPTAVGRIASPAFGATSAPRADAPRPVRGFLRFDDQHLVASIPLDEQQRPPVSRGRSRCGARRPHGPTPQHPRSPPPASCRDRRGCASRRRACVDRRRRPRESCRPPTRHPRRSTSRSARCSLGRRISSGGRSRRTRGSLLPHGKRRRPRSRSLGRPARKGHYARCRVVGADLRLRPRGRERPSARAAISYVCGMAAR